MNNLLNSIKFHGLSSILLIYWKSLRLHQTTFCHSCSIAAKPFLNLSPFINTEKLTLQMVQSCSICANAFPKFLNYMNTYLHTIWHLSSLQLFNMPKLFLSIFQAMSLFKSLHKIRRILRIKLLPTTPNL